MNKRNGIKYGFRIVIGIEIVVLLLAVSYTANAATEHLEPGLFGTFPGILTDSGTHFEINNSKYLNITLDSSELINLTLESIPRRVTMYYESSSKATSTIITLSGFEPRTIYHKYEDDFHNHISFTTDNNGIYSYTQDLSMSHFVIIQPRQSTKFINDDATGGDCTSIGIWDSISKTCTLTDDLKDTIQIDSDEITLDGNGYIMGGDPYKDECYGVYLSGRTMVTVKNLKIAPCGFGIFLYSSNNNNLIGNHIEYEGISLVNSHYNTLTNNLAYFPSNNLGIRLYSSNSNYLIGNRAYVGCCAAGIFLESSNNNNLEGNYANGHDAYGLLLTSSSNNNLTENRIDSGEASIVLSSSNYNNLIRNSMWHSVYGIRTESRLMGTIIIL